MNWLGAVALDLNAEMLSTWVGVCAEAAPNDSINQPIAASASDLILIPLPHAITP